MDQEQILGKKYYNYERIDMNETRYFVTKEILGKKYFDSFEEFNLWINRLFTSDKYFSEDNLLFETVQLFFPFIQIVNKFGVVVSKGSELAGLSIVLKHEGLEYTLVKKDNRAVFELI